jgi:putative membrane-bound dehydrogenase-like protein
MRSWSAHSHVWFLCFSVSLLAPLAVIAADVPAPRAGALPVGKDGKPLNFDFEAGTLKDWTAEGDAFTKQPIKGDTVAARRGDMRSDHAGQFWVGSYEVLYDAPTGTLTSVPFVLTKPFVSFLVAGGSSDSTCVEIVRKDTEKVIQRVSGEDTENLKGVSVDLTAHVGAEIFVRLIDRNTGGWGHLNFDDFRLHDQKPNFPTRAPQLAPDVIAHSGLSPVDAAKAMTVPEGFKVSLFAGEPDVQQPIAMTIDDRGRLWVAEAYSYPIRLPEDKAKDRIVIFEDTDNDGHFDTRKVFTDKLNLVSGMELGFGGVYVGSAPHLLFIPDKDGDDVPDAEPQILLDGWGYQDTHETLNSFIWGPDGWLYGCHGVFTHSRVGKPGTANNKRVPINAGIWRYHPTRHVFEVFAEGTSNPWGIDFNDRGQALETACVIPHLYHMIQGGRYQRQAGTHFNPYTYDDIQTIAKHRHWLGGSPHAGNGKSDAAGGGHAHAGAMVYLGGTWPAQYRDQLFMNNIHGARLNMDAITQSGSGYFGDRAPDFLFANDVWSQVLYLRYGPDGNVYMIDWYDRNQCHHGNVPGHDRSNGRIFKISYGGPGAAQAPNTPVAGFDLKKKTDLELAELQLSPNDYFVRQSRRILQERAVGFGSHIAGQNEKPGTAFDFLSKLTFENPDETRRLRGLWALQAAGMFPEALQIQALQNDSVYVRAWAIQLACDAARPTDAVLAQFSRLAGSDPSPVVRLYLASASLRLPLADRQRLVPALLAHAEDADDHNLPLLYWYASESIASADAESGLALVKSAKIPLVKGYLIRRLIQTNDPVILNQVVEQILAKAEKPADQLLALKEISEGLRGRRKVPMPNAWSGLYQERLSTSSDGDVKSIASNLAITFGDPLALAARQKTLTDPKAPMADRLVALDALVGAQAANLAPTLQQLLTTKELAGPALRGLAGYDDAQTPGLVIAAYASFDAAQKRDALSTLASRPGYATALLAAVDQKKVASADLSADLIRQLRSLKNPELDAAITKVWGTLRDTPEDKAKLIAQLRTMLRGTPHETKRPDLSLGRAVFVKTCQQCHTLFGTGAKVGPELTGSNRANLDYILSNMIDPSAQIGKDYQVQVIVTTAGRTLNGIVKSEDQNSITLATANETVVLPKAEIEDRITSEKSMMPDDILKPLSEREVRSLIAYLANPGQVPLAVTAGTPVVLFNDKDLTGWTGNPELWKVEDGEIVGQTNGLKRNEFLISELLLEDFRVEFDIKLVGDEGNSGIQFRSEALPDGEMKGYQADAGPGWWGKLYEENGRALLWNKSGEAHLKKGDWNRYEISAIGSRVRTWINGQPCVELEDPKGARVGVIGLQLHSGGKTEVRFRNFKLSPIQAGVKPESGGTYLSSRTPAAASAIKFKKTTIELLENKFRSEGVAMGDFNNDGLLDIAAGSMWYEAPKWTPHSLLEKPNEFDKKTYSDTFCNWAEDLDGDGRQDLIVVDFPGKQTWWFQNPGSKGGPWRRLEMVPVTNNESPTYLDVDGDGKRELLYGDAAGQMCLARPATDPFAPWVVTPISTLKAASTERFSHGLGVGDINRDGVNDIVVPQGWWQGSSRPSADLWEFHKAPLGEPQAQMQVFDFDADGDSDVVGSSAHRRGIWFHEQTPEGWKTQLIDQSIAQTHAMCLADINGDGLPDLVTGKRYYAHNGRDPGEDEPPFLSWFELQQTDKTAKWVQHVIDEDSGVGTHFQTYDMNGDGLLDIIVANKRGVFLFEQKRQ